MKVIDFCGENAVPINICFYQTEYRQKVQRLGERMFLNQKESYRMIKAINGLFDKRIKHQRIRKYGERSKIRTLIREEPIKLAQYLREENESYEPASREE